MADGDAQAQQPDPERGVGIARPVAPRRAVVEHHAPRQAVTLERGHQAGLDRGPALVRAGLQTEREARMVIEQGERMAAPGVVGEVSLEVHLPEFVGPVPLEADHRVRREQLALVQAPVAAQNRGDRRGRRDPGRAQVTKPARQLCARPRPWARTSASTARSRPKCSRAVASATSLTVARPSRPGVMSTTSSGPTRPSTWPCPPAATGPARAPIRPTLPFHREYPAARKVQHGGRVDFMGKTWRLPKDPVPRLSPRPATNPSGWHLEGLLQTNPRPRLAGASVAHPPLEAT